MRSKNDIQWKAALVLAIAFDVSFAMGCGLRKPGGIRVEIPSGANGEIFLAAEPIWDLLKTTAVVAKVKADGQRSIASVEKVILSVSPDKRVMAVRWDPKVCKGKVLMLRRQSGATADDEIIPNSSFEKADSNGCPIGWGLQPKVRERNAARISSIRAHTGRRSLRFTPERLFLKSTPVIPMLTLGCWGLPVNRLKGQTLRFQGYVFLERGNGGGFSVRYRLFDGKKWLGDGGGAKLSTFTPGTWEEVQADFTTPASGISNIDILMTHALGSAVDKSVYYLDDITLTLVDTTNRLLKFQGLTSEIIGCEPICFSVEIRKHEYVLCERTTSLILADGQKMPTSCFVKRKISAPQTFRIWVSLVNSSGTTIFKEDMTTDRFEYNTDNLPEGDYALKFQVLDLNGNLIDSVSHHLEVAARDVW